jgi:hypothetical protein
MQPCIGQDLRWVEPRFSDHAGQEEQVELVGDFVTAVAAMNVEDILRDGGQGP